MYIYVIIHAPAYYLNITYIFTKNKIYLSYVKTEMTVKKEICTYNTSYQKKRGVFVYV